MSEGLRHQDHEGHHDHDPARVAPAAPSLNRLAFQATVHCLTGCGIGEVLGLVISNALGGGTAATIALAVVLAFAFGYALTVWPFLRGGLAPGVAMQLAFAADTVSIVIMEIVDNLVVL